MGARGILLTSNLPQLQNLIKRDPAAYRDEFLQQWNHYASIRQIFEANPDSFSSSSSSRGGGGETTHFRELVTFISQVAQCYPQETAGFPAQISQLLLHNYGSLSPDTRKSLVQNLVMLRNKDVISSIELLRTLFPLLPLSSSSQLRTSIRKTILSDIRTANLKSKNHKLNRSVQAMLFSMIESSASSVQTGGAGSSKKTDMGRIDKMADSEREAMWAIILTKELWRKGVWDDAKSVSIVALGCFHPTIKVQSASIHFFLGNTEDGEGEDSDDEGEEEVDVRALHHRREINKKTRSGTRKLQKQLTVAKKQRIKKQSKTSDPLSSNSPNLTALQHLHDPQSFAEKLFALLTAKKSAFTLAHKLLILTLLSHLISMHNLYVPGFYPFLIPYFTPKQLRVPEFLVCLARATHEMVPPEIVRPCVRKVVKEFVHPGVGPEVVAAGINSVREVCRRQPWVFGGGENEEGFGGADGVAAASPSGSSSIAAIAADAEGTTGEVATSGAGYDDGRDLLADLIEYRKSRDKAVTAAARSLLQLYRDVNPGLLKRRERGKEAAMGLSSGKQPLPFGHSKEAAVDIEGLSLLEDHFKALRKESGQASDEEMDEDEEEDIKGWEVDSGDSDEESDEEGWINVDSGDEEDGGRLVISDSEDEEDEQKGEDKMKVDGQEGEEEKRISTLATTKILTPADFSLLNDLRIQAAQKVVDAGGGSSAKRKLANLEAQRKVISQSSTDLSNTFISENDILGPRKKAKADYAERMASIAKGREGREKFGSNKRNRREDNGGSSTTNKEKARNKPIMMIMGSGKIRSKKKASLRDKQKKLREHVDRGKKARR